MNELPLKKDIDYKIISFNIPTPFPIGPVHSYLLFDDKITLVDSGPKTEKAWKAFVYQLNENGFRLKDIDQIILTHDHVDHSGLLALIKEHHPKIRIFAHSLTKLDVEKNKDYLERKIHFFEELYRKNGLSAMQIESIQQFYYTLQNYADPIKVDDELVDGMQVPGNKEWQVLHTPGHAGGHITLYHPQLNILIAGDHILGHTSSGTFIEAPYKEGEERPKSILQYRNSLNRLKQLEISTIYSGHGDVILNAREVINRELDRFEKRANELYEQMSTGSNSYTVYDLMQIMYPNRFQKHLNLYFSEVLSHLDLLEEMGRVKKVETMNLVKYHI